MGQNVTNWPQSWERTPVSPTVAPVLLNNAHFNVVLAATRQDQDLTTGQYSQCLSVSHSGTFLIIDWQHRLPSCPLHCYQIIFITHFVNYPLTCRTCFHKKKIFLPQFWPGRPCVVWGADSRETRIVIFIRMLTVTLSDSQTSCEILDLTPRKTSASDITTVWLFYNALDINRSSLLSA